jgi:hypothetical protein
VGGDLRFSFFQTFTLPGCVAREEKRREEVYSGEFESNAIIAMKNIKNTRSDQIKEMQ